MTCEWCATEIPADADACPACGASTAVVERPQTQDDKKLELSQKKKRHAQRTTDFDVTLTGSLAIGIDPGARHTAVCVIDNETVISSSTYRRDDEQSSVEWALYCADKARKHREAYPDAVMAVEGITDPKGFNTKNRKAPLNPKDIIRTGVVLGAIAHAVPGIDVIDPDMHGDLDASFYPPVLNGRRPKDLLGDYVNVSTRRHEKSAYDIAVKLWKYTYDEKGNES